MTAIPQHRNTADDADIHMGNAAGANSQPTLPGRMAGVPLTPDEFGERYEQSRRTLWFIAAAVLGDRTLAHDVVQEAASIAMIKRGEFDASTNFTAWMGQIVRYVALNEARSRQRRRAALAGDAGLELTRDARPAVPSQPLDEKVAASLHQLDDIARTCLILRVVHGMAYAEISRALNIPEGTAMSHVHRSRLALRDRLAPQEAPAKGAAL